MENKAILVTGVAGFIGFHLASKLIKTGYKVIGVDNLNEYYDANLKKSRLSELHSISNSKKDNFSFLKLDLKDKISVDNIFNQYQINKICHLAAQAGVRYSIDYPQTYIDNNITATLNLLEAAKNNSVRDFIFASTSSVYGKSEEMPFSEKTHIETPISTYASSKRACELLCYTYHNLYQIRFRIMRFFTVYGPWGRPDMALFKFTKAILSNSKIKVFNNGEMRRDFTYVDDIVNGFSLALESKLEFEIFNLGNGNPVHLLDFIEFIESELGITSIKEMSPLQKGDVKETFADISKAEKLLGYRPTFNVKEGISNFIKWYKEYYGVDDV